MATTLNEPCVLSWSLSVSVTNRKALAIGFGTVALFTFLCNTVIIYALIKTRQTNLLTSRLMIAMCISDLCLAVFFDCLLLVPILIEHQVCVLEKIALYGMYSLAYFSFFMLVAMAATRLIHLRNRTRFHVVVGTWRTTLLVFGALLLSNTFAIIITHVYNFIFRVALNIFNFVAVLLVYFIYAVALRNVQSRHEQTTSSVLSRKERSLSRIIKLLLLLMIVGYGPYNVSTILYSHATLVEEVEPSEAVKVSMLWSYACVASISFMNAVLFAYGNTKVKRFIRRRILMTSSSVDSVPHNQPDEPRIN